MSAFRLDTDKMLQRVGRDMTLTRPGSPEVTATVRGFERAGRPEDVVGDHIARGRVVIVGHAAIAAHVTFSSAFPRVGDRLTVDGTECHVVQVQTKYDGSTVIRHDLTVEG